MKSGSDTSKWGIATYSTRVEQWECDFNGHWNTRFYGRAFDQAAAVSDYLSGGQPLDGELNWHIRFQRELAAAASARVFSSQTSDQKQTHFLIGSSGLSATALRWPIVSNLLPQTDGEVEPLARPRGLVEEHDWALFEDASRCDAIPLGMLAAEQFDCHGRLRLDTMLTFCARGSHLHRECIGIGSDFVKNAGITVLLVEKRACLMPGHEPGQPVRLVSRIGQALEKSFTSFHLLERYDGAPVARIEMCLLAVDIHRRKAVRVPDMLRSPSFGI